MLCTPGSSREPVMTPSVELGLDTESVERIQAKILGYRGQLSTSSALFWSGQLMSLSRGSDSACFTHAECLYHDGQFHRCAHIIQQKQLEKRLIRAVQVAAKALYQVKELDEALAVLENGHEQIEASRNLFEEGTLPKQAHEELRQVLRLIDGLIDYSFKSRLC